MKISYNWLKNYIDIDIEPDQLAKFLTNLGLEVESVEHFESVKGGLEGIVIGKVVECCKHPDADKLTLTKVDIGSGELLSIVCGAPNLAAGQIVPVATIGTKLYFNNEEIIIKKGKIRGQESHGMICAEDEMGLGTSHEGIMVLPKDAKIGQLAKNYFKIENDVVFEIGLTPNRIDASSHIGVARDLAAWLSQTQEITYQKPSVNAFRVENNSLNIPVEIENPEACNRYAGVTISGIQVTDSPEWLKNKLKAIGQKPINNVVDITNYVLHETGQPLHAFDAEYITGKKVIVKTLVKGTKFVTLDSVERELSSEDLMICNQAEGMCIAGVFGGSKSGVTEKTKQIFLESAYFNPVSIRKTSKRHGLQTDASFRFERGADINNVVYALKRAALLIKEIAGGIISSEIVDVYPNLIQNRKINVLYAHIDRLIGKKIKHEEIKKILKGLEIQIIEENDHSLVVEVPAYRVDVTLEADVIEEILRIHGYNNVEPGEQVKSTLSYAPKPDKNKLKNAVADMLSSKGFNEIMCNSLTKSDYYQKLSGFDAGQTVKIVNPLSTDLDAMRQSLLPGGLECILYNENHKNLNLKVYEFGNIYQLRQEGKNGNALTKYHEREQLALYIYGNKKPVSWNTPETKTDFYFLKTYTELVFEKLGFRVESLKADEIKNEIFQYGLSYSIGNRLLVSFGALQKKLCKSFDIENEVYYACFEWEELLKHLPPVAQFRPIARFPEVRRDLALLVDKDVSFGKIKELALKTERQLLKSVSIFDVYEGEKLGEGKKSYAVTYILQDEFKTLTDKQIDKIMDKFVYLYEKELGAKIR
jgi:phenylalanyl-tRNA synthetase beta chain